MRELVLTGTITIRKQALAWPEDGHSMDSALKHYAVDTVSKLAAPGRGGGGGGGGGDDDSDNGC